MMNDTDKQTPDAAAGAIVDLLDDDILEQYEKTDLALFDKYFGDLRREWAEGIFFVIAHRAQKMFEEINSRTAAKPEHPVDDQVREALDELEVVIADLRSGIISGDGYYKPNEREECADSLSVLLAAASAAPAWVRCEDRLPGGGGTPYDVTVQKGAYPPQTSYGYLDMEGVWRTTYGNGDDRPFAEIGYKVLAWRERPEPYSSPSGSTQENAWTMEDHIAMTDEILAEIEEEEKSRKNR